MMFRTEEIYRGDRQGTFLLYGAPGTGKTSTLRFLPAGERAVVLDIDGSSHVLAGFGIDCIRFSALSLADCWDEFLRSLDCLSTYDCICLDNLSEFERAFLASLGAKGKNGGIPSLQDYQRMQFMLVNSVRALKATGKRIVLTAWETTDEFTLPTGQKFSRNFPQISPKVRDNIMGLCDVVGRLTVLSDGARVFHLFPTEQLYAKNQLDARKTVKQDDLFTAVSGSAD